MAKGKMVDPDFFIILDRLHETLTKRMNRWYKEHRKYSTTFLGMCRNKKGLAGLTLERMTVAYDLAAAFFYLHENRYVVLALPFLALVNDNPNDWNRKISHVKFLLLSVRLNTVWCTEVSCTADFFVVQGIPHLTFFFGILKQTSNPRILVSSNWC